MLRLKAVMTVDLLIESLFSCNIDIDINIKYQCRLLKHIIFMLTKISLKNSHSHFIVMTIVTDYEVTMTMTMTMDIGK